MSIQVPIGWIAPASHKLGVVREREICYYSYKNYGLRSNGSCRRNGPGVPRTAS